MFRVTLISNDDPTLRVIFTTKARIHDVEPEIRHYLRRYAVDFQERVEGNYNIEIMLARPLKL